MPFDTGVDSSSPALELAKSNASLNRLDANSIDFVKADVAEYMKSALSEGKQWDIVVLDPPKLAPNRKVHTPKAFTFLIIRVKFIFITCSNIVIYRLHFG